MTLKPITHANPALVRNSAGLSCVLAAVLTLSGCGGSASPAVVVPGGISPGPQPVLLANCLDGNQPNVVGVDDPFYVNSWHLENTGLAQVVSASTNEGVAGIDANVNSVHRGGVRSRWQLRLTLAAPPRWSWRAGWRASSTFH